MKKKPVSNIERAKPTRTVVLPGRERPRCTNLSLGAVGFTAPRGGIRSLRDGKARTGRPGLRLIYFGIPLMAGSQALLIIPV